MRIQVPVVLSNVRDPPRQAASRPKQKHSATGLSSCSSRIMAARSREKTKKKRSAIDALQPLLFLIIAMAASVTGATNTSFLAIELP